LYDYLDYDKTPKKKNKIPKRKIPKDKLLEKKVQRRSLKKRRLQSRMSTPTKASSLLQTRIAIRRERAKQSYLVKSQFGWSMT